MCGPCSSLPVPSFREGEPLCEPSAGHPSADPHRQGSNPARRERGPLCPPAGHSTEDPRPNGQRTCLVRNRPLSSNTKKSRDRTRTDIGRCRSLKGNSSIAQGLPRSGYPGWGTSVRIVGTGLVDRSSHNKQRVEFRPCFLPSARLKPAPSGLSRSGCLATQGSAAHEPLYVAFTVGAHSEWSSKTGLCGSRTTLAQAVHHRSHNPGFFRNRSPARSWWTSWF